MLYSENGQLNYQILIEQYMPLVKKIASSIYKKINFAVELDDLIQSGSIGLIDAFNKYVRTDKAKFETYASTKIRGSILNQLRKDDHLTQEDRQIYNAIQKETKNLLMKNSVKPTDTEIAKSCGIDLNDYFKVLNKNYVNSYISLEDDVFDVQDEKETPDLIIQKKELLKKVTEKISELSEKEQILMQLIYVEELNAKEVAYVMGITPARVSQIHTKAIQSLKILLS